VDKDIGLNFTGGGYSNELRQIVNCIEQNWDGSSFLGRLNQQEDIWWSMGWYYGHPTISLLPKLIIGCRKQPLTSPQFYIVMVLLRREIFFWSYIWNYISYTA